MAKEININVFTSEGPLGNYHPTTYLEWEIPKALEEELDVYIQKKLDEFYSKCECDFCKEKQSVKGGDNG